MITQKKNETLTLKFEVTLLAEGPRPANDTQEAEPHLADLLRRVVNGDKDAVGAIAREYGPMLLAEAERVMERSDEAEDAIQEFYVQLLQTRALIAFGPLREWMLTSVRNIAREIDVG